MDSRTDNHLIRLENTSANPRLSRFAEQHPACLSELSSITLTADEVGMVILWQAEESGRSKRNTPAATGAESLRLAIDIAGFLRRQKSFPAPKITGFNQAIGRRSKRVLDATAGWGADALQLCSQGYEVVMIEQHPLIHLMLEDALEQLAQSSWAQTNDVYIPHLLAGDSRKHLSEGKMQFDCIYIDSMFPCKRSAKAATRKEMAFLRELIGEEDNARDLLDAAWQGGYRRVVVKRPLKSGSLEHLGFGRSQRFSSNLVQFDLYLRG